MNKNKALKIVLDMFKRLADGVELQVFDAGKVIGAAEYVLMHTDDSAAAEQAMVDAIQKYRKN